ncbi:MAG: class I SAM-dependent methyltransferase [Gemmatimonadaceae bacterium]|nr:class I SAM-dependent methyltransferase [Gemmatimonadaceae bacterium]
MLRLRSTASSSATEARLGDAPTPVTSLTFKDHFSSRAALYAVHRPDYPDSLFSYVVSLVRHRRAAWDCATGNGQAAVGLVEHFGRVIATDLSSEQLVHARRHPRIEYREASADASGLEDSSVDLVTVAQALHWFDIDQFYAEAQRVLVPGGVIAVWGYGDPLLDTPALQRTLHTFTRGKLESYWRAERQILLDRYQTIPFPFVEVTRPPFTFERRWTLAELIGYLRTWSATAEYVAAHGTDPVVEVEADLARDWGDGQNSRPVRWPLYLRAGYTAD